MDLNTYQNLAKRTFVDLGSQEKNYRHMELGVFGEIGEVLEIIKKNFAYGKDIDEAKLKLELGDIMWYLANLFSMNNINLNSMLFPTEKWTRSFVTDKLLFTDVLQQFSQHNYPYLVMFVMNICNAFNLKFDSVLEDNINKLKVRYPESFDSNKAIDKDEAEELKVVELNKQKS